MKIFIAAISVTMSYVFFFFFSVNCKFFVQELPVVHSFANKNCYMKGNMVEYNSVLSKHLELFYQTTKF